MDLVRLELNRSPRPKDSPVPPPLLNSTTCVLFLSCGRRLAYCEWGARDSPHVLIYFNGILGSRLEGALADSTAREQGVRLISCDRPGIGLSDLDRKATVRSVAEDAVELIDRVIGKERKVALHASSGGAPYACAACGILKERVIALFLAAPVGPYHFLGPKIAKKMDLRWRLALCTASRFPFFAHLYLSRLHDKYHGRQTIMANRQEVPADRDAVANPTTDAILTFSAIEAALRHGGRGTVGDMRAIVSNWHFNPDDLAPLATRGAFYVFHGTCDTTVPPEWTQEGYAKVPGAIVRFWEGDGHASTIARASDEVGAILRRMFLDSDCGGRGCPVHGRGANDDRLDSGVIE